MGLRMGTNYYIKCNHCETELHHIGKNSGGWMFSIPFEFAASYEQWLSKIKEKEDSLYNEYGEQVTVDHMISIVESNKDKDDQQHLWDKEQVVGPVRVITGGYG